MFKITFEISIGAMNLEVAKLYAKIFRKVLMPLVKLYSPGGTIKITTVE